MSNPFGTPAFGSATTNTFGSTASTVTFGAPVPTPPSVFTAPAATTFASTTPSFGATPFGATTNPPTTPALFGGFSGVGTAFGTPSAAPASAFTPAVQTNTAQEVSRLTRFEDLPENIKQEFIKIQRLINEQKRILNELNLRSSAETIPRINKELTVIVQEAVTLQGSLEANKREVDTFKTQSSIKLRHAENAKANLHRFRSQPSYNLPQSAQLPTNYYVELIASFDTQMQQYANTINELERYFAARNIRSGASPAAYVGVIRSHYDLIVRFFAYVATTTDRIEERREAFRRFRRDFLGDYKNPFDDTPSRVIRALPSTPAPVAALAYTATTPTQTQTPVSAPLFTTPMPSPAAPTTPANPFASGAATTPFSMPSPAPFGGPSATFGGPSATFGGISTTSSVFQPASTASGSLFGSTSSTASPSARNSRRSTRRSN